MITLSGFHCNILCLIRFFCKWSFIDLSCIYEIRSDNSGVWILMQLWRCHFAVLAGKLYFRYHDCDRVLTFVYIFLLLIYKTFVLQQQQKAFSNSLFIQQRVLRIYIIVIEPIIYIELILTTLEATAIFWGSWGSSKNQLELKIEPELTNLACLNRWNTLYEPY